MFDYIVEQLRQEPARPRYLPAGVSAIAHVLAIGIAVGLPILYASGELPEPPNMMAFVMEAPVPPPPPAPPTPAVKNPDAVKPNPTPKAQPLSESKPITAPVEAPPAIMPETGLGRAGAVKIEAGFESGVAGGVAGGVLGGIETGAPPPPPKPVSQGPVRVGGAIKAPELTHRVNPVYPPAAQSAQVEGSVMLEATVDGNGRVQSVRVARSHALLEAAAIAAVKQWRYEPLLLNGQPTPFILTVTINFSIPR